MNRGTGYFDFKFEHKKAEPCESSALWLSWWKGLVDQVRFDIIEAHL